MYLYQLFYFTTIAHKIPLDFLDFPLRSPSARGKQRELPLAKFNGKIYLICIILYISGKYC